MAEVLRRQESIAANHLDLSCFSCREHVDQLSCLPCLHSLGVCERKECLEMLTERGAFCQHCKEHFDVSAEGFPRYAFAERKAAANKMEEDGTFCHAKHDTPQIAVTFCSDCPGPLCEECHSGHRMVAVLREHRIVPLEDSVKAGLASQHPPLCLTHKEELKCFCQDCEVLICTVCPVVGPHQSHSVLFVDEEVGGRNRQPLEQCIRSAEKRIEEMSSAVRDIDDRLLTLHEEGNRCKEDIADLKQHMIEAVNRRCAVLVAEVEEAEEKRRRDLEQHKKALEAQKNQLDLFKTSAADIVQEGTTREQLSLRQSVIQRASSLMSISPPPPLPFSSSVFFVPLSVMACVSLGPDPEASSMEGLSIVDNTVECRPWGLPLSVRVVSRHCRGVECGRGGERVESVLTPTSCGVPVQGEVEDREDGTYQVTFKCLPSQECRLSVTVNGSDIRGSPVTVKLSYPSSIKQEIKDREGRRFQHVVCTNEGALLVTDTSSGELLSFDQSGELLSSIQVINPKNFEEVEEGAVSNGHDFIGGIATLSDGNIAVSVYRCTCVAVYTPNGELVKEFGSDRLNGPFGLAVNHRGQLFVVDNGNHRVCVFTENGEFQYSFGSEGEDPGQFYDPEWICINQDGLVYTVDFESSRFQVFQQDGQFVRQFGEDVVNNCLLTGPALTKDGHIVVVASGYTPDYSGSKLFVFTRREECVYKVDVIGLDLPNKVAIADDGSIFVSDFSKLEGKIVKL